MSLSFGNFFNTTSEKKDSSEQINDVVKGIKTLYNFYNDHKEQFDQIQRYLISGGEGGFPDLLSKNSATNDPDCWWTNLLANGLDDPLTAIKEGWEYAINSSDQLKDFVNQATEQVGSALEKMKNNVTVELN